jgi:hypothetical protein
LQERSGLKIDNWTTLLASQIEQLRLRELEHPRSRENALVAAATAARALPVYGSFSGTLLISEEREILEFDDETKTIRPVDDRLWRTVALVSAAKKFPELTGLAPSRTSRASDCVECEATGQIVGKFSCAVCGGTGWLDQG